jgi:hypothetical protein
MSGDSTFNQEDFTNSSREWSNERGFKDQKRRWRREGEEENVNFAETLFSLL